MNFSEMYRTVALVLLSSLVVKIINHMNQKSIPKKVSFQGSFAKADTCKEFFPKSFGKINKRLVIQIHIYWIFLLDLFQ